MTSQMPCQGAYGIALPHWRGLGTQILMGVPHDGFCARQRYHVLVSRDVPGEPGWHVSVRDWCSDSEGRNPRPPIPAAEWRPDIDDLELLLGVRFALLRVSAKRVWHFHQVGD
jgi:hypothetical protein